MAGKYSPSKPNKAVIAARARRAKNEVKSEANIEWFIKEVSDKVEFTLKQRMQIVVEYLRTKVVKNISVPVEFQIYKSKHIHITPEGKKKTTWTKRRVVTKRSKPGEYPRADTTMLMKTIFGEVRVEGNQINGYIGTPLDYGLILETNKKLNRSFLVRTLYEEKSRITRILTGPII